MKNHIILAAAMAVSLCLSANASSSTAVPFTFQPGAKAVASEVNDNFAYLADEVDALKTANVELTNENNNLKSRLASLEAAVSQLQSDVDTAEVDIAANSSAISTKTEQLQTGLDEADVSIAENQALIEGNDAYLATLGTRVSSLESDVPENLADYLFVSPNPAGSGIPQVEFRGVNVLVTNGSSVNHELNGTGNLIIGYNNQAGLAPEICSSVEWNNPSDCESAGYVWSNDHRTGSHNLIMGRSMSYASFGNILQGDSHASNSPRSAALAGYQAKLMGARSAIVAGYSNKTSEEYAVVVGGSEAVSSGQASVVVGGDSGQASGLRAVVIGGSNLSEPEAGGVTVAQ